MDTFRDGREFLPEATVRFSGSSAAAGLTLNRFVLDQLREQPYTYQTHMLVWARSGSGSLEWHCQGRRGVHRVQPGELIFQPAQQFWHRGWLRGVDCVVLHLEGSVAGPEAAQMDWRHRVGWRSPLLSGMLAAAIHEAECAPAGQSLCLEQWGARLRPALAEALGAPAKMAAEEAKLSHRELERVLVLAESRVTTAVTLTELAEAAGCASPIRFLRRFRRTLGVTPYEFFLRLRLDRARTMLETGQHNVGETAACLGFSDQSHLVRHFRKRFGQPPSHFARRVARSFKPPGGRTW